MNKKFFTGEVQEGTLLDITVDGGQLRGRSAAARRSKILEIKNLVAQATGGGDAQPLAAALETLAAALEQAIGQFEQHARRMPELASFCRRNIDAYGRARAALDEMYAYFQGDPSGQVLTSGYSALERAVHEIDELVNEEEAAAAADPSTFDP